MTQNQIIKETILAYENPIYRALYYTAGTYKDATCRYRTASGNMCSVGRCMTDRALNLYGCSSKKFAALFKDQDHDQLLQPKYRGHSLKFWSLIQELHDNHVFWSNDGITEKGVEFLKQNLNYEV